MQFLAVLVMAVVVSVSVQAAVQPYVVPIYRVTMNAVTLPAPVPSATDRLSDLLEASQSRHPRSLGSLKGVPGFTFEHVCSGTLVDDNAVITTASCIDLAMTATIFRAFVGTALDVSSEDIVDKVLYEASKIIKHPNYDSATNTNNIAVLKLYPDVDYTQNDKISHITWSLAVPAKDSSCVASYWNADTPFEQVNQAVTIKTCDSEKSGTICSSYPSSSAECPAGANGASLVCDSKLAGIFTAHRNADCSAALWQYEEISKDAEWIWKSVSGAPILNVSFAAILAVVAAMLKSL